MIKIDTTLTLCKLFQFQASTLIKKKIHSITLFLSSEQLNTKSIGDELLSISHNDTSK